MFFTEAGAVHEMHELSAKDQRQDALVKKIVAVECDPPVAVFCHNVPGHQAVQVKMGLKLLVPGVQDGPKSRGAAEFIFTKAQERLGSGGKQADEHEFLMILDYGIEFMRQGEDHMEVVDRQNFLLAFSQPPLSGHVLAFGAVAVSAGVISDAQTAAGVAAVHPAAQFSLTSRSVTAGSKPYQY
jgi:hypothetical protein